MIQFLQANGLDPEAIDTLLILNRFRRTMHNGLAGRGPLPMIPAGFVLSGRLPTDTDIPAFDVGGTNTRAARVHFDANGRPTVSDMVHGAMPGVREPVDNDTFYTELCTVLQQVLRPDEKLGFCFSYPVTAEGKLLFWTKGVQAEGIVGSNVKQGLSEALRERGLGTADVRILNDTVAALLAAYPVRSSTTYAGHVGFILGTGTNTAYAERTERITKDPTLPAGKKMPINCETGNFTDFPRSFFDNRYEAITGNGRGQWERCISGVHLGPLGTEILHMAAETGLFSDAVRDRILDRVFTNVELDTFCAGTDTQLIDCSSDEADTICRLLRPMYLRAARFAAVNIAAAALASAEANGAMCGKVLVNVDGSTFWKTACIPFRHVVAKELADLLTPQGFSCEIIRIQNAPLIGAAMAVC